MAEALSRVAARPLQKASGSAAGTVVARAVAGRQLSYQAATPIPHCMSASGVAPRAVPSPLVDPRASQAAPATSSVASNAQRATPAARGSHTPTAVATDTAASSTGKREEDMLTFTPVVATPYSRPSHAYRCAVHVPPKYHRRELAQLFHGLDKASASRMSLVTIALRTDKDMATWSPDVADERDVLTKEFHTLASRAVDNLRAAGHWADYIDPTSGQAHHAAASRGTFLETDDRLEAYGFGVLDYGCCKAISHPDWGTHVMVGVVFTDAPHEIVVRLADIVTADSPPVPSGVAAATSTASAAAAAAASSATTSFK